ncbi:MAG: hypothetical protein RBU27_03975, partial [Bacteroidota bacterium]|nr:hypothetical protein [Bacteroidota bacterium]
MVILRSLQGIFLAAALLVAAPVWAQEHQDAHADPASGTTSSQAPVTGLGHETAAHDQETGTHGQGEAGHQGDDHHGSHDVSTLTPTEEMMRILEHKVENTPYIHEYPFPTIDLPRN